MNVEYVYYAHTPKCGDGNQLCSPNGQWQLLIKHLCSVATIAQKFASNLGLNDPAVASDGCCAGLFHDLGKYRHEFQRYLRTMKGLIPEFFRQIVNWEM